VPTQAPTPVPAATPVASAAPAAANAVILPFSGGPSADGSAQAVAIAPTAEAAAATDAGATLDSQNLFWLITAAFMAIPLLIVMTLLATVLTRR
jgi:hypothetical protein